MSRPRQIVPGDLHQAAEASRRQREWRAQAEAWARAEEFLNLANLPNDVRTRMKMAFTLGWQSGANYHTARPR